MKNNFITIIFIILPFWAIAHEEKPCYTFAEIESLISVGQNTGLKKVCMSDVNFEFNMSTLGAQFERVLDELASHFDKYPYLNIVINAHTDDIGSDDYNMELSQQRAETVYNYLVRKGIARKRLSCNHYGKTMPVAANDTEEGRAKNRRVEFEITVDIYTDALSSGYFRIENGEYQIGTLPAPTVSQPLGSLLINKTAIPGGTSHLELTATDTIEEFYVSVGGQKGYFVVPAENIDDNTYDFLLFMSQYLEKPFTFIISGKSSSGEILEPLSENIQYVDVGSGALQISLSFNKNVDLDLHVITPDGVRIYYNNKGDDEWGLDLDSNADCFIDGVNNENIFFPASQLIDGKYEVFVHLFLNCSYSDTNWVVIATHNGSPVVPTFGKNPATGKFSAHEPGYTADLLKAVKVMEFYIRDSNK